MRHATPGSYGNYSWAASPGHNNNTLPACSNHSMSLLKSPRLTNSFLYLERLCLLPGLPNGSRNPGGANVEANRVRLRRPYIHDIMPQPPKPEIAKLKYRLKCRTNSIAANPPAIPHHHRHHRPTHRADQFRPSSLPRTMPLIPPLAWLYQLLRPTVRRPGSWSSWPQT